MPAVSGRASRRSVRARVSARCMGRPRTAGRFGRRSSTTRIGVVVTCARCWPPCSGPRWPPRAPPTMPRVPRSGPTRPVLVPIPSTARAARERGGDHMRRLAASAGRAERLGSAPILRVARPNRGRGRAWGAGPPRQHRRRLRLSHRPGPCPVILVDDVITTGASLLEAARTVRAAGHRVQGVAVVAIVPLAQRTGPASRSGDGPADEQTHGGVCGVTSRTGRFGPSRDSVGKT